MAVISPAQDVLVVRVVYDGPPFAGKTTSLKTLADKLGGRLSTPAELGGRTVYFDWLDYTGGLFEGRRIRCQIVSVPGQAKLAARRRRLLEDADAVVFVCDTTHDMASQARSYLQSLRAALSRAAGPAVGIVLQANKRDQADAIPLPQLRSALGANDARIAIIESVATDGAGIREAFVFAVRLALDRVRELMKADQLQTMQPLIDSADELLAELKQAEGGRLDLAIQQGLQHTRLEEIAEYVPTQPRSDLPGGMIWPPVEGRLILHEATLTPVILQRDRGGAWRSARHSPWLIQSPAHASFRELAPARAAMLAWARAHAACSHVLSTRRCIALAADGLGGYRLWQCVALEPTLHEMLERELTRDAGAISEALLAAARAVLLARAQWVDIGADLPARIDTITLTAQGPRYGALMPYSPTPEIATALKDDPSPLTCREFAPLGERLAQLRPQLLKALDAHAEPTTRVETAQATSLLESLALA